MRKNHGFWLLLVLGTGWYLLEVYGAFFVGSPLPLPTWYFLPGILIILVLSAGLMGAAGALETRYTRITPLLLIGSAWFIIAGKLYLAGGIHHGFVYLWVSLPFVLLAAHLYRDPGRASIPWYLLLVLLSMIVSTDLIHHLWNSAGSLDASSLLIGLITAGVGSAIFLAGNHVCDDLAILLENHRRGVVYGLVLAVILVGLLWFSDRRPAPWEITTSFSGSLPQLNHSAGLSSESLPNVILISADSLRKDHVTPPWPEELEIPHLKALRKDSLRMRGARTTSSRTLSAHASLLTGEHPLDHGALGRHTTSIDPRVPLFSQHLKRAGYATAAFTGGKPLGKKSGFLRGFDHFWQPATAYRRFVPGGVELTSILLAFTPYEFVFTVRDHEPPPPRPAGPVFRRAHRWIQSRSGNKRPFFVFLHTFQVHDYLRSFPERMDRLRQQKPRLARAFEGEDTREVDLTTPLTDREIESFLQPEPFLGTASGKRLRRRINSIGSKPWHNTVLRQMIRLYPPDLRQLQKANLANISEKQWVNIVNMSRRESRYVLEWHKYARVLRHLTPTAFRARRWLYHREIEQLDATIGSFLSGLKEAGLYEDTLIIFLSDHGEGFSWDPFVMGHGIRTNLDWEGQINDVLLRIPLWMKLPNNRFQGEAYGGLVQITDVFPMLFRHLQLKLSTWPGGDAGLNLTSILRGQSSGSRSFVQGTIESRKRGLPKFFVQNPRFQFVVNTPIRTSYFHAIREHSGTFVAGTAVPGEVRRRLRRKMHHKLKRFLREPTGFEEQKAFFSEYLDGLRERLAK